MAGEDVQTRTETGLWASPLNRQAIHQEAVLPHYFFNVRSEDRFVRDEEGGEYPSVEAAKAEAEKSAREMLADALIKGEEIDGNAFEVIDTAGALIFTYPFRSAMKLP